MNWDDIISIPGQVGGVVEFWSDPFGNLYKAGRESTIDLAGDLIPAITESTLPDLTLPSFLSAYAVSFALSMLVAVLLIIAQLVRTARGRQSGQELIETFGLYLPGFLIGAMFGPAFGLVVVEVVRALSRSMIEWAYQGTIDEMVQTFGSVIAEDPAQVAGGAVVGAFIVWAMVVGLFLIVAFFIVQLVVLYFSGILIPLTIVWMVDPRRRQTALGGVALWVGMLFVHPLLFFMLGFAFRLAIDGVGTWGSDGWRNLVNMVVAGAAIILAELAPFFLVGMLRKTLANQAASPTDSPVPIGPRAPASHPGGGRGSAPGRSIQGARQPVRADAVPAGSRGATARAGKAGKETVGRATARAGSSGAKGTAAAKGGAATTAARGAGVAGAVTATAVQGAGAATRRMRSDANAAITPPAPTETHGKERPQ